MPSLTEDHAVNPQEIGEAWAALCKEFEEARQRYNEASAPVNAAFSTIYEHKGRENPTLAQCEAAEAAWNAWQDVRSRMKAFAAEHAR
jgi:hypothetical protein